MLVNNMLLPLMSETVWFDKYKYDEAERLFEERNAKKRQDSGDTPSAAAPSKGSIVEEIAKTRERIQNSLKNVNVKADTDVLSSLQNRVQKLEAETQDIKSLFKDFQSSVQNVLHKIQNIEQVLQSRGMNVAPTGKPTTVSTEKKKAAKGDDDDLDLFGSDEEEDEDVANVREQRLKAYAEKKAKKAPVVAKSSVILDVKPWDDETDLKQMEGMVRKISMDGLVWGASKLVPLAYGIQKLQIVAVVEDEKVSIDELQETIQEIEDLVQSVDVAAFNKL